VLPFFKVVVVIESTGAGAIWMLNAFEAVAAGVPVPWSLTVTVKFAVTLDPEGVPVIRPLELIVRPAGSIVPPLRAKLSVPVPPPAATCWL
jgi:hypothetical protein